MTKLDRIAFKILSELSYDFTTYKSAQGLMLMLLDLSHLPENFKEPAYIDYGLTNLNESDKFAMAKTKNIVENILENYSLSLSEKRKLLNGLIYILMSATSKMN
jgi:hypothetical protein